VSLHLAESDPLEVDPPAALAVRTGSFDALGHVFAVECDDPGVAALLERAFAALATADEPSERYRIDADLIHCVIAIESNFDPKAVSPKNARGLMQLMPQTAAQFGVKDVFDPEENVNAGTRYLRLLMDKYNNLTLALAAYNAGPERVDQYGRRIPPYLETMKYVQRIAKSYAKIKADTATQPLGSPVTKSAPSGQ